MFNINALLRSMTGGVVLGGSWISLVLWYFLLVVSQVVAKRGRGEQINHISLLVSRQNNFKTYSFSRRILESLHVTIAFPHVRRVYTFDIEKR